MKKVFCAALALILTLALLGCGTDRPAETTETTVNTENYMSAEQALSLAKEQASRNESDLDALYNVKTELLAERGFYTVSFESDTAFYEYDIDAVTGKLMRGKRKGKPQTMAPVSVAIPNETATPEVPETTTK